MPTILIGKDAKCYYSNNSTKIASPTPTQSGWLTQNTTVVADNLMDVSIDLTSEVVDATTREEAATGWRSELAVLRNGRINFDMRWELDDDFKSKIITAWNNMDYISLAFLDQPKGTIGAMGIIANFSVSLTKNEALVEIQKASVSLTIHSLPLWYEVS